MGDISLRNYIHYNKNIKIISNELYHTGFISANVYGEINSELEIKFDKFIMKWMKIYNELKGRRRKKYCIPREIFVLNGMVPAYLVCVYIP